MSPELIEYCHAQDGLVLLPVEALGQKGLEPALAEALLERGTFAQPWIETFDSAFRLYWQRLDDLHRTAGRWWFPPRVQHIGIVTRPDHVRPYFQPFHGSSWLLYASDFDLDTSSVELATFLMLHTERMGLLGQIDPTLVANLSYLLTLDSAQAQELAAGCERTTRPDAAAFQALGTAMPWLRQLHHQELRPPPLAVPGSKHVPGTGLIAPPSLLPKLETLQAAWSSAARGAWERHRAAHKMPAADGGARIVDWLQEARPPLLITGEGWDILWDPEAATETAELESALRDATEDGAAGILADLQVVAHHSHAFLASMRAPEDLVDPAPYITEGGLSYIHKERKLIAYHIGPGENEGRLWQSTPPYERWMLAGRTVHEWGHLAAESGWIHVPEATRAARETAEEELVALCEAIHHTAPDAVKAHAAEEVREMRAKHGSIGRAILKRLKVRIEDFQANLLARHYLSADQMDTYVRNNVSGHMEPGAERTVYHQLARQAYEVQYLRLSRIEDPLDWFLKSTWFRERFVATGIVTEALFARLVETIGRICDTYAIDRSKLDLPATPTIGMPSDRR